MRNKKYLYIIASCLFWVACSDTPDDSGLPASTHEVSFTGFLGEASFLSSKTGETVSRPFPNGATMGVYAYKTGHTAYQANGENQKYECTNQVFSCIPVGQLPLYWPTKGNLNFIAYSPYKASMSPVTVPPSASITYPVDVTDQSTAMATDVLFATKAEVSGNHGPVQLTFGHALARLNIILEGAFGTEFVEQPYIRIKGLKTTADITISLEGANISNPGVATDMVPFRTGKAEIRRDSISMLVIPQELSIPANDNGLEFIYIKNGDDMSADQYRFKLKPDAGILTNGKLVFKAGKEYTLTLTLKNKEAEIKNAHVEINDWIPGSNASGEGEATWPER